GLEIKYALDSKVKFTKCQLDQFRKDKEPFKGVIALINVKSAPEIWFIGAEDLDHRIPNPQNKYEPDNVQVSRNGVEWTRWEFESVEENFLKLFKFSNT